MFYLKFGGGFLQSPAATPLGHTLVLCLLQLEFHWEGGRACQAASDPSIWALVKKGQSSRKSTWKWAHNRFFFFFKYWKGDVSSSESGDLGFSPNSVTLSFSASTSLSLKWEQTACSTDLTVSVEGV